MVSQASGEAEPTPGETDMHQHQIQCHMVSVDVLMSRERGVSSRELETASKRSEEQNRDKKSGRGEESN